MALLNPGEFITCENGHLVGEIIKPLDLGQMNWGECAGHWRIENAPVAGAPIPRCPCGARFCAAGTTAKPNKRGKVDAISGMLCYYASFHIEGRGWVPPLPEGV